jgi:hypothetical protein
MATCGSLGLVPLSPPPQPVSATTEAAPKDAIASTKRRMNAIIALSEPRCKGATCTWRWRAKATRTRPTRTTQPVDSRSRGFRAWLGSDDGASARDRHGGGPPRGSKTQGGRGCRAPGRPYAMTFLYPLAQAER